MLADIGGRRTQAPHAGTPDLGVSRRAPPRRPVTLLCVSPANPDDMIGRLIDGRYQVRSLIARGGMATVYVATDVRLERRVAIKVMHEHLAADENFRARFIREARSAAKLAHPNIVGVFDQGEDDDFAYIVMEYIPGITLRDLLHDHHRLTAEQTIDVMDAVLSGLQAAHRLGIVHRDLKPENVLLADDGRIKLGDFGLARAASADTASGSVLLGTIAYLSPELITKGTADIRSDIYSLGIMMYEMLTGEQPYRGDQPVNIAYRHANDDVPPPSDAQSDVPAELDDIVTWATERDPEDRPADAGGMLAALRQAESDIAERGGAPIAPGRDLAAPADGDGEPLTLRQDRAWDTVTHPTDPTPLSAVTASLAAIGAGSAAAAEAMGGDAVATAVVTRPITAPPAPAPSTLALEPLPEPAVRLANANRQKRRAGGVLLAIAIILAVVAGGTGWWFGAGPGSYAAAPSLIGAQQADAVAQITQAGFAVAEIAEQHSLDVAKGTVMSMDPAAGTHLAPGTAISITVSAGPEVLTVPQLVGHTLDEAKGIIAQARFAYDDKTTLREFSKEEAGTVIKATDSAGGPLPTQMAEQSPIRLIISAGPLPDVEGKSEAAATQTLKDAGLEAAVVENRFSSSVPAGVVISAEATTDPVRPGDTINLVVSKGPEMVDVPNVVGQDFKAAVQSLQAAGFKVQHSVPQAWLDDPKMAGKIKVATQNPAAGGKVEKGATITLTAVLSI